VARHDSALSYPVDCGTYYIVADTFKGASEYAGAYTLNVSFAASSQACGSGPPSYQFEGKMGADCAYPGNQNLPFCNPNLGATTCIYTANDSFCSKPCSSNNDCGELSGGCCADIGNQEFYCLTGNLCGGGNDPGVDTGEGAGPQGDPSEGELGGAGGVDGSGSGGAASGGAPGSSAAPDDDDDTSETGGCSIGHPSRSGDSRWGLLAAALALAVVRQRRRR
jgi:MYXO-CTERM domain-containing protein